MAPEDKNKDDKKVSTNGRTGDTLGILLAVAVLFILVQQGYVSLKAKFITGGGVEGVDNFRESFTDFVFWLKIGAVFVSAIFIAAIFYVRAKFMAHAAIEKKFYFPDGASSVHDMNQSVNNRWDTVVSRADSDNPNDWKIAILEADIILDDMLDHLGYTGNSMGDKLKQIEKSDFLTLDKAWEAHKVRNAIAHEGSEFLINHREVLRILELYKDIFDEFYYV